MKPSFIRYVRTIAGGTCDAVDGAVERPDGSFEFPLRGTAKIDDGWALSFGGALRCSAHHGFLDVELRDLELRLRAGGGTLDIATEPDDRLTIATIAPTVPAQRGNLLSWLGIVGRLTEAGVPVFGNVYPAGTELAPLDAVLSLDAVVPLDS